MSKNTKVLAMAAMAMALGGLPGLGDEFGTHADPLEEPKAKDPNDPKVAKAEAKRARKAAKRQADLVKQQLAKGTYQVPE